MMTPAQMAETYRRLCKVAGVTDLGVVYGWLTSCRIEGRRHVDLHKDHLDKLTEARRKHLLNVKIVKLIVNFMMITNYNLHQSSSVS